MKKMERHKNPNHDKIQIPRLVPAFKKRCYPEKLGRDEARIGEYLITREVPPSKKVKIFAQKSVKIVRQETIPVQPLDGNRVITLNSSMKLDGNVRVKKGNNLVVQDFPGTVSTKNDRLVIELSDYLTLTKTKNVGKFKLKPISSKYDSVNPLSPIDKIIDNANTFKLDEVLKGEVLTKATVKNSKSKPQRSFLLVPQETSDSVSEKPKSLQGRIVKKKSKTKVLLESSSPPRISQNIEQNDIQDSSIQISDILEDSTSLCTNTADIDDDQKFTPHLSETPSNHLTKVTKKIKRNQLHSLAIESTKSLKKGKQKVMVLTADPYFSEHEPFIIKHKPAEAKVTKHQSCSLQVKQESLLDSEFNVVSISESSELIDEIKYEIPEEDVNIIISEETASISQAFPIALQSTDSDDFEYLAALEDEHEILTESDMQILGI